MPLTHRVWSETEEKRDNARFAEAMVVSLVGLHQLPLKRKGSHGE